jgi:hypothetical protein
MRMPQEGQTTEKMHIGIVKMLDCLRPLFRDHPSNKLNGEKMYKHLTKKREDNLHRKVKNLIARFNKKGLGFLRYNRKTLVSTDIGNECPKEKEGNPCAYCYKALLYKLYGKTGFEQGKVFQTCGLIVDKLHDFCRELRKILKVYGISRFSIRMFSLGDITDDSVPFWTEAITVMRSYFHIHAVTKQYRIIQKIAHLLDNIQLSIDSVGSTDITEAIRLRFENPEKYRIRCVMLSDDDAHLADIADIITLYHGNTIEGLKTYRTNHRTYLRMANEKAKVYENKTVCCQTGKCTSCGRCHVFGRIEEKTAKVRETITA